jgi:hypothetical protein
VNLRGAARPSRWRSVVAIVAGLSLVAAALGCWTLRPEIAAGPSAPVVASLSAPDAGPGHLTDGSTPANRADFGSTLNDDKAFKSGGLKRDRATTFSLSAPRSPWTPASLAPVVWARGPGEVGCRASATVVAGQTLLAQLCVCRR